MGLEAPQLVLTGIDPQGFHRIDDLDPGVLLSACMSIRCAAAVTAAVAAAAITVAAASRWPLVAGCSVN